MASGSKEVEIDFSPFFKVYKDGTLERMLNSPYVAPSFDPTTNVSSKDITISSNVSARLYLPMITDTSRKLPILVYFHGGGFCLDSAFSLLHHRYLNHLISKANAVTVSVEYRLAPEHPLPAAYEDCWAALQWVASHVVVEGSDIAGKEAWLISHGDFDKVYLGGDSAGGNIAHNMAMRAGAESLAGGVKILGAFLSCAYFCDYKTKKGSNEESLLYKIWMFVYPSAPGGINNPLINPFADDAPNLSGIGCQKVFVFCAEKDELRDINLRYVEALKKSDWAGKVELVDVEGEDHCFHALQLDTEKAQCVLDSLASFISGFSVHNKMNQQLSFDCIRTLENTYLLISMASNSEEAVTDLPHIKDYKDGTVERLIGSPYVPPSVEEPITGVSSKDVTIPLNFSARLYLPKIDPVTDPNQKLPI